MRNEIINGFQIFIIRNNENYTIRQYDGECNVSISSVLFRKSREGDKSYCFRVRRLVDAFRCRFLNEGVILLRFFVVCMPSGAGVAVRIFSMSNERELCACMRRRQAQF